jgi:hypothetical protein
MAKDPARKPHLPATTPQPGFEDQIRLRAYAIYEERGREDGHDLDDWLRAEEELMAEEVRGVAA